MKALKNICKNCKHYKACESPCAFVDQLLNGSQGLCDSCPHKEHCTKPCFFAECLIDADVKPFFEKTKTQIQNGKSVEIIVVYDPYGYQASRFSDVQGTMEDGAQTDTDNVSNEDMETFHDNVFYTRSQKLGIFMDKFFNNFTYEDLAIKYETTPHQAINVYNKARQDFLSFIALYDKENRLIQNRKLAEANLENATKMSKRLKCFLLHYVFELPHSVIAEIMDASTKYVSREIKLVEQNVEAGINVLQFDESFKPRGATREEVKQQRRD